MPCRNGGFWFRATQVQQPGFPPKTPVLFCETGPSFIWSGMRNGKCQRSAALLRFSPLQCGPLPALPAVTPTVPAKLLFWGFSAAWDDLDCPIPPPPHLQRFWPSPSSVQRLLGPCQLSAVQSRWNRYQKLERRVAAYPNVCHPRHDVCALPGDAFTLYSVVVASARMEAFLQNVQVGLLSFH